MHINDISVLIIDDSDHIRALFAMTMTRAGVTRCHQAKNGEEGVRMFRELRPTIVFLDNMLPLLSGMEVLRQIKATDPASVVVMISGASNIETIKEAKEAGAAHYIIKPYSSGKVVDVMTKLLSLEGAAV